MTQTPAEQFADWLVGRLRPDTSAEHTEPTPADTDAGKPHGDIGQAPPGRPSPPTRRRRSRT